MTDKQQENGVSLEVLPQNGDAAAATVSAQPNPSPNPPQKEAEKSISPENKPEPEMSKGEKVFNWTTYKGLNYWVNLGLSVVMADIAISGKGFWRKGLDISINRTTQFVSSGLISLSKNPNKEAIIRRVHNNARVGYESLSLLTGGSVLLFPLKFLEDNKRKIVHWLNDKLGVDQTAPDGHKETPEEIHIEKEQPKQSAKNLIWRRVIGILSVVGAGLGIDHLFKNKNKILDPETHNLGWTTVTYDKKIQGGKNLIETKVFDLINKAAKAVSGKEFKKDGRVSRWTKLAILDSMFTVITATVMWATSGAKRGKMPQEIDNSNDPKVIRDEMDRITTTADLGDRAFSDRIEKRVSKLVEAKHKDPVGIKKGFVEALQPKDSPTVGVGV